MKKLNTISKKQTGFVFYSEEHKASFEILSTLIHKGDTLYQVHLLDSSTQMYMSAFQIEAYMNADSYLY